MALTQEELDRKKFSGEGTGITRKPVPTLKGMLGAADRAIGRGVDAVAGVPGKVMNAITPERRGYSGEVNPIAAVGGFMSRVARSAPNTFGGAEMAASAGQRPLQGFGFGSAARAEQPAPVAAQMDVPVLDDQSKVAARENLTGTPAPPSTPANPVATPPVPGPTNMITAGAQGQDGYGMARRGLSDGSGAIGTNRMGTGQVGGYSFRGTGADFAKFARQPTRPVGWDGNTVASQPAAYLGVRDRYDANRAAQDQLAGLDPRSGWGWKGRQELYKHQQALDQRDREVDARTMMDAAQLQVGQQQAAAALAQGQQQFDAQQQGRDVDMQAKQLEIQSLQKRQEIINRLDTTTDPNERRALQGQLLAMQGKDPAQKYQVVTRKGFDPVTQMPTETPYAVNQDDPTQSFEISGQPTRKNYEAAPRDVKARIPGQVYVDAQGRPVRWDGKGFKLAE